MPSHLLNEYVDKYTFDMTRLVGGVASGQQNQFGGGGMIPKSLSEWVV